MHFETIHWVLFQLSQIYVTVQHTLPRIIAKNYTQNHMSLPTITKTMA